MNTLIGMFAAVGMVFCISAIDRMMNYPEVKFWKSCVHDLAYATSGMILSTLLMYLK